MQPSSAELESLMPKLPKASREVASDLESIITLDSEPDLQSGADQKFMSEILKDEKHTSKAIERL